MKNVENAAVYASLPWVWQVITRGAAAGVPVSIFILHFHSSIFFIFQFSFSIHQ
jgi:hypothetical protein